MSTVGSNPAAGKTSPPPKHHHRETAADVVSAVAKELGIPPAVALAIASNESGLNPHSVGDNGSSFGLFQLHEGGELGNHPASWAFNPYNNARTALSIVASVHATHPGLSWGEIAAMAQRPADPQGYAAAVNGLLAGYHASGEANPVTYFLAHNPAGAATGNYSASHAQDYLSGQVSGEFGYLSAFLNNPEIGPIIREASAGGWSQARLQAALEGTNWWKHTSQSAREMQALQQTDPATYHQQWAQMRQSIAQLATQSGIHIANDRINQMATTALFSGWDSGQIQQAVGAEFRYNPHAAYTGTAGTTISKLKANAAQYLVPLSNQAINNWSRQVLEGKKGSADDYTNYLQQQAKLNMPWMAHAIDAGVTPEAYLDSYKQAASQTLELDPNQINLADPKWRRLYETVDPKTGQRTERGLADAMTMMRTDNQYGYDRTQQARQEAASFASNIAQAFGFQPAGSTLTSGVPSL